MENKNIGICKIHFLSEAVSPITHMMGVSGNESILNREKVVYKNHIVDVPVLSGNALRHKLIREPGALHLVKECGLNGKLNIDQANFMFTGGSLTESSTSDNIPLIKKMQESSPLFRLLGGCLRNQVIGGSLLVSRGLLVCAENMENIKKMCPSLSQFSDPVLPAQHFVSKYQYTRGDAGRMKDASDMIKDLDHQASTNLMIYAGESVIQGAMFYHNLTLYNVSLLEVGCALHAVSLWQASGGIVGGSARIGHGKLSSVVNVEQVTDGFFGEKEPSDLVIDYLSHVESNKEAFSTFLNEAFR